MDMERWKGRVALVTGASSGIGLDVVRALAGYGMRVVMAARRTGRMETLAREMAERGAEVLPLTVDLREEAQIRRLFDKARETFGGVDVIVNNAGLGLQATVMDGDTEEWREMFDVNVMALLICTREAVRDMRERGVDGHVINISSLSGYSVYRRYGVYASTKYAVRAITEATRQELAAAGTGIRATAISPGLVRTEFADRFEGSSEAGQASYERVQVLEPPDVTEAVVYALSQPAHVQINDVLLRSAG